MLGVSENDKIFVVLKLPQLPSLAVLVVLILLQGININAIFFPKNVISQALHIITSPNSLQNLFAFL